MKERSLILKPHELAGILAGRQSRFCRPVTGFVAETIQWYGGGSDGEPATDETVGFELKGRKLLVWSREYPEDGHTAIKCPFGQIGDVIYVREAWRVKSWWPDDGEMCISFPIGGNFISCDDLDEDLFNKLWEESCSDLDKAGYVIGPDENYSDYSDNTIRLRRAITMPKSAARIWLQVEDVAVLRVQDMSPKCMLGHGVTYERHYEGLGNPCDEIRIMQSFEWQYQSAYSHESWELNPWIWSIKFKVLSTTGRP